MIGQTVGFSGTFAALALLVSAGLAQASPDFRERTEVDFKAPEPIVQASVEPAASVPAAQPTAAIRATALRHDTTAKGLTKESPRQRQTYHGRRVHYADPIDVVAARAKVVRARFRARFWHFTLRPRF